MEPTDYPPMSGSNSICVATVLLETGMLEMQEPQTNLILETPVRTLRQHLDQRVLHDLQLRLDCRLLVHLLRRTRTVQAWNSRLAQCISAASSQRIRCPHKQRLLVLQHAFVYCSLHHLRQLS